MEKNLTILDALGMSVHFPDMKCSSFPNILRHRAGYISQAAKCASSLSPPCAHSSTRIVSALHRSGLDVTARQLHTT